MELSAQQERARSAILEWYRSSDRKPWFLLEGSAGTGKSSCITATTDSLDGDIVYLAPTAKAALVMRNKGCPNPRTVHSAIYTPKGMSGDRKLVTLLKQLESSPTDALRSTIRPLLEQELNKLQKQMPLAASKDKEPKRITDLKRALLTNIGNIKELLSSVNPMFELNPDSIVKEADLIVLDEVSMISARMMEDILSFGVPVLAQGDPWQLPPIKGQSFFIGQKSDFLLTEIHRQAKESPIIYLAELARKGQTLPLGKHGNCLVTSESVPEEAMAADQILVGKHTTRWATNEKIRHILGRESDLPEVGDRLICRHNNNKIGLVNGDQFTTTSFTRGDYFHRIGITNETIDTTVLAHKEYFEKKEPNPWHKSQAECLDYAYSITVHLAQGSQWDTVYVKDESRCFGADRNKWLYTAATRPVNKLIVKVN